MDYIKCFNIYLEKDVYYQGETISGCVILENYEPLKIKNIRCFLRGRTKVHWKMLKSGETRILKDNQYIIDEKLTIFGKDKRDECSDLVEVLPVGRHQFKFSFVLPQSQQLPCSLETKYGTVRYYIKVLIDIVYKNAPQGIKYFSFIGPHIDCMEEKFLSSLSGQDYKVQCLRCCQRGTVALRIVLERNAYCCGENIHFRAHVENRQDISICICIRLFQHIEYTINQCLTENKKIVSLVIEYRTIIIDDNSYLKLDSSKFNSPIQIPVVPPTMIGICRLIQIYYIFKVSVEDERKNEILEMNFPLTIATLPYRSSQSQIYTVSYDYCVNYIESGKYISPEFRVNSFHNKNQQEKKNALPSTSNEKVSVNNINNNNTEKNDNDIILYRPVYVKTVNTNVDNSKHKLIELSINGLEDLPENKLQTTFFTNNTETKNSLKLSLINNNNNDKLLQETITLAPTPSSSITQNVTFHENSKPI